MLHLDDQNMEYEAWVSALYPFMDIPALVRHCPRAPGSNRKDEEKVLADGTISERSAVARKPVRIRDIIKDSLQGSALSALILGMLLGLLARPESVYTSFYEPMVRGFLSILMLMMGIEAWQRLGELRRVAHWYAVYAALAPLVHGGVGFALGAIAHYTTGFSPGGVVLLAILAASSSDISGPPTPRAGIPKANPLILLPADENWPPIASLSYSALYRTRPVPIPKPEGHEAPSGSATSSRKSF